MKRATPFTLPTEPVDKHEVFWWRVEHYQDIPKIVECRAVYHANATWREVIGDDGGHPGASFVKQWQIFHDGHFTSRSHDFTCAAGDGWNYWKDFDWSRSYATRHDAAVVAQTLASDLLSCLDERAEALRLWLAALRP